MLLRPACLAAVWGIATFFVALSVRAEERRDGALELTWHAPEGCPSEASVREAVRESAGADPVRPPSIVADARVERRGVRWHVVLETAPGWPARQLEASSCAALADATAVIVAGLLISSATSVSPRTNARASLEPASSTSPEPVSPTPAPPLGVGEAVTVVGRGGFRAFHGVVAGVVDVGSLPTAAAGARIGIAWTPRRARVELVGSYYASQSRTTGLSQAGADLGLVAIEGRGCFAVVTGTFATVAPCAGVVVDLMTARGFGGLVNYDASGQWTSVTGGGLATIPIASWLSLRATADAQVPLTRPEFVVEGDGSVHRPAALGLRTEIGAEVHFP